MRGRMKLANERASERASEKRNESAVKGGRNERAREGRQRNAASVREAKSPAFLDNVASEPRLYQAS